MVKGLKKLTWHYLNLWVKVFFWKNKIECGLLSFKRGRPLKSVRARRVVSRVKTGEDEDQFL